MEACKVGDEESVRLLLKSGAQVDIRDNAGNSAIIGAYEKRHIECGQLLINSGAVPKNGMRILLMRACDEFHLFIAVHNIKWVESILKASTADINMTDDDGRTLLMKACINGNPAVIEPLLNNGAQVDLQDKSGKTALISLAQMYPWYQSLGQGVPMLRDELDKFNLCMELLVKSHADVNLKDYEGKTTLMILCESELDESVELLIRYGAKLDLQDNKGNTALMVACQTTLTEECDSIYYHRPKYVRNIVRGGANVNLQNSEGTFCPHDSMSTRKCLLY